MKQLSPCDIVCCDKVLFESVSHTIWILINVIQPKFIHYLNVKCCSPEFISLPECVYRHLVVCKY